MKTLLSLTMVLAFFVAVPQCLGQSQDAEENASQLLTEQQLAQMVLLLKGPAPQNCHQTVCNPAVKDLACPRGNSGKDCRALAKACKLECTIECHDTSTCGPGNGVCFELSSTDFFQCSPSP